MDNQSPTGASLSFSHVDKEPLGQVLCFVSAKGGTGKTILSAATAYALGQSGLRVVAIDTDFSTRGLSLFLLGSVLESHELRIQSKNCLANSILDGVPVKEVAPLRIIRGAVEYNVIISNKDVFRGGAPDDRFLGGGPLNVADTDIPMQYYKYLRSLCERFRTEYDYVILDTRGGYDFTGAVAATLSDGYVLVLEADRVSIEQFSGLRQRIDDYSASLSKLEERKLQAVLKGFIINKAIFSVDETVFPDALYRLYESKTFGVIPVDKDAIRAYQKKNLPQEKFPDSDFSYHSLCAIQRLTSPSLNWASENAKKFERYLSSVRAKWATRRRVELAQQAVIPLSLILLAGIFCIFYLSFKHGALASSLRLFYITSTLFILVSIIGSMFSTLALLRIKEVARWARYGIAGVFVFLLMGLAYLASFDIPKTFSQNILLQRVQERDKTIAELEEEKDAIQRQVSDLNTENQFLKTDKGQLARSLSDSQDQIAEMEEQISAAKAQAASIKRDRDAAQSALAFAEQRATTIQQRLDECQRKGR